MPPIDLRTAATGSPEWFLGRLYAKLQSRRAGLERLDRYYEGDQPLKFAADRFRKAFGNSFKAFAENVMPLVVDTVEQRLDVVGFKVGGSRKTDSAKAWDIWQANQMDSESEIAHSEALTLAMSYVLVWNSDDSQTEARITVESAHETIVEHVPGSRWERAAALKAWRDDWTGLIMATLYLPGAVYKFASDKPVDEKIRSSLAEVSWVTREPEGEPWPLPNPFGRVPVIPLYNKPRLRRPPRSEIEDVIPSQDAINKLTADMLVASEFAAFRQRVLTGVDIPRDPKTNEPIRDYWKQSLEAFLLLPKDSTFGSIEATDLNNYVTAIEHEIQKVATRTQTPPHYFFLRGEFPSGESITAAEAGLVSKVRRKMRHFEDAWEEVIELAMAISGTKVDITQIETQWRDPESRTESQHADAVGKRRQMLDVPVEQSWEDAGYTPTQIDRMRTQRAAELAAGTAPSQDSQSNQIPGA